MTRTRRCSNRRKLIVEVACFLLCFLAITLWPFAYIPLGRILTGRDLDLREPSRFDDGSWREGACAWIYQIAESDAATLNAERDTLRNYPMWSADAFIDHKKQIRWQSFEELENGPDRAVIQSALKAEPSVRDARQVGSLGDAQSLAASLAKQPGVLISGNYDRSNYCIYVLDLKQRVLINVVLDL